MNLRHLEERLNMIQEECNRLSEESDDELSATIDDRSEKNYLDDAEALDDENILGGLSRCRLRPPNFENPDLPGWVGGGRMVVCGGWSVFFDLLVPGWSPTIGRSVAVGSWDSLLPSCLNKLWWNSDS